MASRATSISVRHPRRNQERKLTDLAGIGPAMLEKLDDLGITSVRQLARCDARKLYRRLCALTGQRIDPCAQDVFSAAIAHARDPKLDAERRCWWYWSRVRKNGDCG